MKNYFAIVGKNCKNLWQKIKKPENLKIIQNVAISIGFAMFLTGLGLIAAWTILRKGDTFNADQLQLFVILGVFFMVTPVVVFLVNTITYCAYIEYIKRKRIKEQASKTAKTAVDKNGDEFVDIELGDIDSIIEQINDIE